MNLNYEKYADGLVPVIVQDAETRAVLMLGFMNAAALRITQETSRVTFYSRSRQQLWTKGEKSGKHLEVVSIRADCDEDTLLVMARPTGPVCHTGAATCFAEMNSNHLPTDLLMELEKVIDRRRSEMPESSYVASLFEKGINKIAQKVGEEAVELVIEAKDDDADRFRSEAADLLFHYLILLRGKGVSIDDVVKELEGRRK
ncbi:MAG: bifunctional phosphoribosyl-AMP cyclohydrolase/phosphoribosyl-ATP diphosphatase HisIE [Pyrinomonadaceae bacterium]|nr:bifunctional phosphoribosyl-AMP cyclohydrolase/phosphoribosyl-ATP diphosphatase HisIE [Pyrinomonadaceae bacterium]MBP9108553.1 bifunctional phosphoribosyl-AMP cyclohydrolase/phosphoribosyl-ATP diphosphatase HisIE [Pyrinomonadaceae bacterium]